MRYCRISGQVMITPSLDFLTPELNVLFARLRENITETERKQIYLEVMQCSLKPIMEI